VLVTVKHEEIAAAFGEGSPGLIAAYGRNRSAAPARIVAGARVGGVLQLTQLGLSLAERGRVGRTAVRRQDRRVGGG
jgi:hypothetical protein